MPHHLDPPLLIPEKSREKYESVYARFEKWCSDKKLKTSVNEKVILVYFEQLSKISKPSSLWTWYSMLRTVISIKKNIDISKYVHLIAFLKSKSQGYQPKKSKMLTKQDVTRFLLEAADSSFLLVKVF